MREIVAHPDAAPPRAGTKGMLVPEGRYVVFTASRGHRAEGTARRDPVGLPPFLRLGLLLRRGARGPISFRPRSARLDQHVVGLRLRTGRQLAAVCADLDTSRAKSSTTSENTELDSGVPDCVVPSERFRMRRNEASSRPQKRPSGESRMIARSSGALAPLIDWTSQWPGSRPSRFDHLADLLKKMDQ